MLNEKVFDRIQLNIGNRLHKSYRYKQYIKSFSIQLRKTQRVFTVHFSTAAVCLHVSGARS